MPKAKPAPAGLIADTKTYESGVRMFRILDTRMEGGKANQVLFESSREETRDYVLERMLEREAEKKQELLEIGA